jgi:hypothetical protein
VPAIARADSVRIECEEDGFWMEVDFSYAPHMTEDGRIRFNIHSIDLDAFYDQVKARIGPYLRERDEARRTLPMAVYADSEAYELSDPKHPDFHSVHVDLWDARDGK